MPPIIIRPKRSNPLALAVLALLFERPMHPYEMAATLKERHKEDSIKLRYGSLYTVIDILVREGHITLAKHCGTGADLSAPCMS
ncbi:PadR family transcriptional regulator [Verrucomicrobium spinosum]|uniref:PadR family transcriptional regulator n=1 Tax=Verrucomicrobium spinosum TaxID=2736 RepID=UPI000946718E|nr:helix-turn-helix transcriptional regulator [Verrucomicrobium spinosum]